jgi:HAD superfamily hydrolase (TIGR01509 family)
MNNLRLIIFDMDGVVLNSEPLHEQARQAMFRKYHVVQGKDFPKAVGFSASGFWRRVIEQQGIDADPMDLQAEQYTRVEDQIKKLGLGPIEGAAEAFDWAKKHGLKLAIASSSTQPLVDHALALIGVKDYFDIILSGADVHHKKPDPEIYCRVLEMAGIPPENAVAIEDTASGVVAAQGAGLYCFGFHNPDSGSQDLNHADKVIESLKELPGYFAAMIGEE